jgi:hypothetical protein
MLLIPAKNNGHFLAYQNHVLLSFFSKLQWHLSIHYQVVLELNTRTVKFYIHVIANEILSAAATNESGIPEFFQPGRKS